MEEMWKYCNEEHRGLKRIDRFLGERRLPDEKCKGIIILDGVICERTRDFGPCDRYCFFSGERSCLRKSSGKIERQNTNR